MITIPLTQGKQAVADDGDRDLLQQHHWYAVRSRDNRRFYAMTKIQEPGSRRRVVGMHRLIMGEPVGLQIDHISGDSLDNRRQNLRVATTSQNMANTTPYTSNHSGYKGVYWKPSNHRWEAQVRHQGKLYSLGRYTDIEEAARAYDAKARELHGSYARCNFPDTEERPDDSQGELIQNPPKNRRIGRSGFRNVSWHRVHRCWVADINYGGKRIYIGSFKTPEDAARAYDAKARDLFGEFALLNFPQGDQLP